MFEVNQFSRPVKENVPLIGKQRTINFLEDHMSALNLEGGVCIGQVGGVTVSVGMWS